MKSLVMKTVKETLKDYAKEITPLKKSRKLDKRNGRSLSSIEYDIWCLKRKFRHLHIAYCEIRGRERSQIEKPKENNLPDESYILKLKKEIQEKLEREQNELAICVNS